MSTTPLKAGDPVNLLPMEATPCEVKKAGRAGLTVVDRAGTWWWRDRGVTWQSDKLDRIDSTRTQFSNAVHDGGKTA